MNGAEWWGSDMVAEAEIDKGFERGLRLTTDSGKGALGR